MRLSRHQRPDLYFPKRLSVSADPTKCQPRQSAPAFSKSDGNVSISEQGAPSHRVKKDTKLLRVLGIRRYGVVICSNSSADGSDCLNFSLSPKLPRGGFLYFLRLFFSGYLALNVHTSTYIRPHTYFYIPLQTYARGPERITASSLSDCLGHCQQHT